MLNPEEKIIPMNVFRAMPVSDLRSAPLEGSLGTIQDKGPYLLLGRKGPLGVICTPEQYEAVTCDIAKKRRELEETQREIIKVGEQIRKYRERTREADEQTT